MIPLICDPRQVRNVKDGLNKTALNIGIGILHEPTGHICLASFDDVPSGHDDLVTQLNLPANECKGFGILLAPDGTPKVVNASHLNGPQGQPGSVQMPQATFDAIVQALVDAGL